MGTGSLKKTVKKKWRDLVSNLCGSYYSPLGVKVFDDDDIIVMMALVMMMIVFVVQVMVIVIDKVAHHSRRPIQPEHILVSVG